MKTTSNIIERLAQFDIHPLYATLSLSGLEAISLRTKKYVLQYHHLENGTAVNTVGFSVGETISRRHGEIRRYIATHHNTI